MTWMHTCCWTDHSRGCPRTDVDGAFPLTEKGARDWYEAYHGARVRRGYEQQETSEEMDAKASLFYKIMLEDDARAA